MRLGRWITGAGAALMGLAVLTGCDTANAERSEAGGNVALAGVAGQNLPVVTVYKNPSCACCGEWVEHLEQNGFQTEVEEAGYNLMQIKAEHGVAPHLSSCHTAVVGDYVIEGHVPADVLAQLLRDRPDIRGLAVPGMPAGVPGMPDAGPNRDPYEILAIQQDGSTQLYATR